MKSAILLLLLPGAIGFEVPFSLPKLFRSKVPTGSITIERDEVASLPTTPRIAIIGAGAGGSSAAFWISKAQARFGLDVEIDVYDKLDYIGGRSTIVYPYENTSLPELELGASIFVTANKNLWRASEEFNLSRRDFHEENYEVGLWDGKKVVFNFEDGWWGTAKAILRYGILSPKRTQDTVDTVLKKYLELYSRDSPKWDDVADLSSNFGWTEMTASTTAEYLLKKGISGRYINEIVEAASRVNYGQNADYIHALEGIVSLAADGAVGIDGGNFKLFEQFLKHSRASVHLNTMVTSILPKDNSKEWTVTSSHGTQDYKAVILSAPFHSTNITVPHSISDQVPPQPYVHLHVTLLSTTSEYPNSAYFGEAPSSKPARMMLTTYDGVRNNGKEPEFNSLSYHGLVRPGEWAVKIFSQERITDQTLNELFGSGQVGWVFRKEWDAYPRLPPTTSFPPVKLDQGFYYVNSFEPFISTMETETISARNIVDLLLNDEFQTSICGPRISESDSENTKNASASQQEDSYVYGWDC